jgi:hypothetical protein
MTMEPTQFNSFQLSQGIFGIDGLIERLPLWPDRIKNLARSIPLRLAKPPDLSSLAAFFPASHRTTVRMSRLI